MKFRHGWVEITKAEYDETPDELKGRITSEYTSEREPRSYMWNRTLYVNGRMYVERMNLYIRG